MNGEKYVINCPHCGKVEGYLNNPIDPEDVQPADAEEEIIAETFETQGHPVTEVRCPKCGRWLDADLVCPAD